MRSSPRTIRLMAALLSGLALGSCREPVMKREEWVEVEVGFENPEARANPFLAAERFLNEMGMATEPRMNLVALPPPDTLLLLPAEAVRTRAAASLLLEWAAAGGHVVYLLEGADAFKNDFVSARPGWNWETADEDEDVREERIRFNHPFLHELGVRLEKRDRATERIRLNGQVHRVSIPKGQGFRIPEWLLAEGGRAQAGPAGARGFATFSYRGGRITLVADAHPFRNRFLPEKDHAPLLWDLARMEPGTIRAWIVRGMTSSFWALLWRHGWMPLLSLMVLIFFWLWKSMPRFGPLLPVTAPVSRDFSEHLQRTGNFLWRRRAVDALLEPIRHRIRRRAHDRLLLDTSGDASLAVPAIAERAAMPEDRVRELLDHPVPKDGHQFTRMVRDLQNLENQT